MEEIRIGKYRHFKGNEYEVIGVASHSETMEKLVVYKALYGEGGLWVRPASMWNETVERDGKIYQRFTYIGEEDETQVTVETGDIVETESKDEEDFEVFEDVYRIEGRPVVKLGVVIEGFDVIDREMVIYYDLKEHDLIIYHPVLDFRDPELRRVMDEDYDRFVQFPDYWEFNEYGIMEDFIEEIVPAGGIRRRFEKAIDGRGAFRRFDNLVDQIGFRGDWNAYRKKVYREKAIEWCEENELDYEE